MVLQDMRDASNLSRRKSVILANLHYSVHTPQLEYRFRAPPNHVHMSRPVVI